MQSTKNKQNLNVLEKEECKDVKKNDTKRAESEDKNPEEKESIVMPGKVKDEKDKVMEKQTSSEKDSIVLKSEESELSNSSFKHISEEKLSVIEHLKDNHVAIEKLHDVFKKHDARVDTMDEKIEVHAKKLYEIVNAYSTKHEKQCQQMYEKIKQMIEKTTKQHQQEVSRKFTLEHDTIQKVLSANEKSTQQCSEQEEDIRKRQNQLADKIDSIDAKFSKSIDGMQNKLEAMEMNLNKVLKLLTHMNTSKTIQHEEGTQTSSSHQPLPAPGTPMQVTADDTQRPIGTTIILTLGSITEVQPGSQINLASESEVRSREEYEELKLREHPRPHKAVRIILDCDVHISSQLLKSLHRHEELNSEKYNQLKTILHTTKIKIDYGCVILQPYPKTTVDANNLLLDLKNSKTASKLRELLLTDEVLGDVREPTLDVVIVEQDFVDVIDELEIGKGQRRENTVRLVLDGTDEESLDTLSEHFEQLTTEQLTSQLGCKITDIRKGCILLDLEIESEEQAQELLKKLKSGELLKILKNIAEPVIGDTDKLKVEYFEEDFQQVITEIDSRSELGASTSLITGLAPPPVDPFIGRDVLLENIHKSYKRCKQDIVEDVSKDNLVLTGADGSGKTQIAINYVHRYHMEYPAGRYWINASTLTSLDHGFHYMFKHLDLKLNSPTEESTHIAREMKKKVLEWLDCNPGWLIILDDITDYELIKHYFPTFPSKGHIIITSRSSGFHGDTSQHYDEIAVPRLSNAASQKLMLCTQGVTPVDVFITIREMQEYDKKNYKSFCRIVDSLKGQPLALSITGSLIKSKKQSYLEYEESEKQSILVTDHKAHGVSIDEVVEDVKGQKNHKTGDALEVNTPNNEMQLISEWKLNNVWPSKLESIGRLKPAALSVLQFSSFMSDVISVDIVKRGLLLLKTNNTTKLQLEPKEELVEEVLGILQYHNLALLSRNVEHSSFSIPKAVQLQVRGTLKMNFCDYMRALNMATLVLTKAYLEEYEPVLQLLSPEEENLVLHVTELQTHFTYSLIKKVQQDDVKFEDPVRLLDSIGYYLRVIKQRPRSALPVCETSFRISQMMLSPLSDEDSRKKLSDAYYTIANVYISLGKISKSLQYQDKGKKLLENSSDNNDDVLPKIAMGDFQVQKCEDQTTLKDNDKEHEISNDDVLPKIAIDDFQALKCKVQAPLKDNDTQHTININVPSKLYKHKDITRLWIIINSPYSGISLNHENTLGTSKPLISKVVPDNVFESVACIYSLQPTVKIKTPHQLLRTIKKSGDPILIQYNSIIV
uniref:Uncharacterized protein LOC102800837 n=1 Tax=Saccoglossus kowalevskii TaxID=10224 RepID=A0ABM0MZY4_SACKO|nr:PREDICTED: uncharacterized protein LOC102800837 [Saccoglossus kowalevskii]